MVCAVARVDGDADAGGDEALLAGDEDGLAQGLQHALGDALGVASSPTSGSSATNSSPPRRPTASSVRCERVPTPPACLP
jgi:hypothetical protein